MTTLPIAGASLAGRTRDSWVSAVLLLVVISTVAVVDQLAASDLVRETIEGWVWARFADGRGFFPNRGNFEEFEDRLLLDEIPAADYSRGGVYFLGSSDLKWSLKTYELPDNVRPYVGNYGLGAINHTFQLDFIRHLIEHQGLTRAGPERTLVVIAASRTHAFNRPWDRGYFPALWSRHGLYRFDGEEGIQPVEMSPWARARRVRKARRSGFLRSNLNRLARFTMEEAGFSLRALPEDEEAIRRSVTRTHAGREDEMLQQVAELGRMIDYLRGQDVHVAVALLPHRPSLDLVPVVPAYRQAVTELCRRKEVTLADLSHMLEEDEYYDITHPTASGLEKSHRGLMSTAIPHLRELGILEVDREEEEREEDGVEKEVEEL